MLSACSRGCQDSDRNSVSIQKEAVQITLQELMNTYYACDPLPGAKDGRKEKQRALSLKEQ